MYNIIWKPHEVIWGQWMWSSSHTLSMLALPSRCGGETWELNQKWIQKCLWSGRCFEQQQQLYFGYLAHAVGVAAESWWHLRVGWQEKPRILPEHHRWSGRLNHDWSWGLLVWWSWDAHRTWGIDQKMEHHESTLDPIQELAHRIPLSWGWCSLWIVPNYSFTVFTWWFDAVLGK